MLSVVPSETSSLSTKARPVVLSKVTAMARSAPVRVVSSLASLSKTSTEVPLPTQTLPVAGSGSTNVRTSTGSSAVSVTSKVAVSTRRSTGLPSAVPTDQAAPWAASTPSSLPPSRVAVSLTVPVAISTRRSSGPAATRTVEVSASWPMPVKVAPVNQTPCATVSPSLAVPMPRSG